MSMEERLSIANVFKRDSLNYLFLDKTNSCSFGTFIPFKRKLAHYKNDNAISRTLSRLV